jgi:hypothetical protein
MTKLATIAVILAAGAMQAPAKTELERPADWITRADSGTDVASPLYFVNMPPGWHITTGPGTILYNPGHSCPASCVIETEIYLFPGQSVGGYGVFLGGHKLDEGPGPYYDVFMLRWDGAHARGNWIRGVRMPAAAFRPEMSQYVVKGLPDKPVRNVLRVEIDAGDDGARIARFSANGHVMYRVHAAPPMPGGVPLYTGTVGLRVDAGVNIHVTRFTVTQK